MICEEFETCFDEDILNLLIENERLLENQKRKNKRRKKKKQKKKEDKNE